MVEMLLRRCTTMGIRKGLGGSRPWLAAGIVAIGIRVLRRLANPPEEVLYRTEVKPGDVFEITPRAPGKR
jgi:hypothetical protein